MPSHRMYVTFPPYVCDLPTDLTLPLTVPLISGDLS